MARPRRGIRGSFIVPAETGSNPSDTTTNGDLLWEYPTNSGVTGAPSSFEVDGTQYIAVQSGWGVDAERMIGTLRELLPEGRVPHVPQGGAIWVFALKDKG